VPSFIDDLNDKLSKKPAASGKEKAEETLIHQKIATQNAAYAKAQQQLGEAYYLSYRDNSPDPALREFCAQMTIAVDSIRQLNEDLLGLKGLKTCTQCGKTIVLDATFCSYCGATAAKPAPAGPVAKFCPQCGSQVLEGHAFCQSCGHSTT
jgi:ribosomal protein L32